MKSLVLFSRYFPSRKDHEVFVVQMEFYSFKKEELWEFFLNHQKEELEDGVLGMKSCVFPQLKIWRVFFSINGFQPLPNYFPYKVSN